MRGDLDRLMAERKLDALMVMGNSGGNSVMNYLTGGAHLEGALIVKRRGAPVTLIHGGMERDSAAATGLALIDRDKRYNPYELLRKHEGNRLAAYVDMYSQVIQDQGLTGRLGIYGKMDVGEGFTLLNQLADRLDGVELVGEYGQSLFELARSTKDDTELAELAEAGRLTCQVVGEVQAFIQSHRVRDEVVMRADGEPLTIGHVKAFIRRQLQAVGMNEDHGTIFSQGRDAGVPHNSGNLAMPLRLGRSIIFDIFPQLPSGYFHDMTRTWSLGYATDEVQQAWDQTKQVFDKVMGSLTVGQSCRSYQEMTLDFYESLGHKTVRTHPGTHEGYVHGLGHGIGLDVHEGPNFSHAAGNDTLVQPGHVVTIEPGLYYPDLPDGKGFGVRIEDAVAFNEAGELVWLTDYPYDLVVPMK